MSKKHLGSSIDEFLKQEGVFEETQAQAVKEVVAWQLAEAMKKNKSSKKRMAALLKKEPHAGRSAAGWQEGCYLVEPATRCEHCG